MQTFTDFKKDFYSKVKDLEIFDCGEINILKVVLDGIRVNYVGRGPISSPLFYHPFFYTLYLFVKRITSRSSVITKKLFKELQKYQSTTRLIIDSGRYVKSGDGTVCSLYFENIKKIFHEDDVITTAEQKLVHEFPCDFFNEYLYATLKYQPITSSQQVFRKQLLCTYIKIKESHLFSKAELINIKFAIHKFFTEYKIWICILEKLPNIKKAYFVCHYHKEGLIYAFKKKNIQTVELQHGLIAEQDVFYVMPAVIKKVSHKILCADEVYTYGEYWKKVLMKGCEYPENKIKILGYYLFNDFNGYSDLRTSLANKITGKQTVILVTTQISLHSYYIDYIQWLKEEVKDESVIILVKPHPAEKISIYAEAFKGAKNVHVVSYPTDILFEYASIVVSIYSTTLFDAMRYGIECFALYVDAYKDYVDGIVKSGIAQPLQKYENPLKIRGEKNDNVLQKDFFYAPFEKEIFLSYDKM